jgi:hypothetical protein
MRGAPIRRCASTASDRVPSETRDALVLATRGKIRPLAEMVQNARHSEVKASRVRVLPSRNGWACHRAAKAWA